MQTLNSYVNKYHAQRRIRTFNRYACNIPEGERYDGGRVRTLPLFTNVGTHTSSMLMGKPV